MKKVIVFLSYVLTAALACCATLFLTQQNQPGLSKLDQLEELIDARFIAEHDRTAMEDAAAAAMVNSLGDRWSYYIPASEYSSYLERTENAYVGVGITIQQQEGIQGMPVVGVQKGGSAMEAGVEPGDVIVAVDGRSVVDMDASQVRDMVRGEPGTTVVFTVLRGETSLDFTLERRKIESEVASGRMLPEQIGLVTIENFDDRCAKETLAAVRQLVDEGARGLIFDVRNNPGGYAHELVAVLDYLLPEGDLFRTVDYKGTEHADTSDESFLDLPMAVLCNENSYSAAEFFAAALQEYGAGIVVGQQTCGKGYFQNTFRLIDGSAVGLSVGKYFTPKGNSLIGVGIIPDIPVEVDDETFSAIYYGTLDPMSDPQVLAAWETFQ